MTAREVFRSLKIVHSEDVSLSLPLPHAFHFVSLALVLPGLLLVAAAVAAVFGAFGSAFRLKIVLRSGSRAPAVPQLPLVPLPPGLLERHLPRLWGKMRNHTHT